MRCRCATSTRRKARERALSTDEIRAFLKAAFESNIRRQFKIGLHLILLTMVRKSELLLARWEHVDFEQAEWHIPAFTIHDLRRTASTLLLENGWPPDVVEKALNHTIGGVRGVYNRAEHAPQRREMLQFRADTNERLMTTGQVVMGRFKQVA